MQGQTKSITIISLLLLIGFFLRFYNISFSPSFFGDESMHIPSAINYTEKGIFGPDNWYHPPLKHLLLYVNIKIFGNNVYGWRMRNIIFGTATIIVLYLLAKEITGNLVVAFFSSLFISLDPLHILFSRSTFEDIPATFFIISGIVFFLKYIKSYKDYNLILSGILFGLAVSCRLYSVFIIFVLLCIAIVKSRNIPAVSFYIVYLVFLPLLIYILVYFPWFQRGYSITEWVQMQSDALREISSVKEFHPILMELKGPERWFISFIGIAFCKESHEGWSNYFAIMNNLPLWIFTFPALIYLILFGIIQKNINILLIPLLFFTLYIPFLIVDRPIFLYSALPVIPFAFIAISYAAVMTLKRFGNLFLGILSVESLLLYPLTGIISIPDELYSPILQYLTIYKP